MKTAAFIVCSMAASGLVAAEVTVRDLRLGLEARTTDFSYEIEDRLGSRSGDDTFSRSQALVVDLRRSLALPGRTWGVLLDVGANYAQHSFAGDGRLTAMGVQVGMGVAVALANRWTATLLPLVGYGRGELSLPGVVAIEASGPHREYGIQAGLTWQWAERWVAGIETGYVHGEDVLTGSGVTDRITTRGFRVGLFVGWRWSTMPTPLE